jgi:hypothetical protein
MLNLASSRQALTFELPIAVQSITNDQPNGLMGSRSKTRPHRPQGLFTLSEADALPSHSVFDDFYSTVRLMMVSCNFSPRRLWREENLLSLYFSRGSRTYMNVLFTYYIGACICSGGCCCVDAVCEISMALAMCICLMLCGVGKSIEGERQPAAAAVCMSTPRSLPMPAARGEKGRFWWFRRGAVCFWEARLQLFSGKKQLSKRTEFLFRVAWNFICFH